MGAEAGAVIEVAPGVLADLDASGEIVGIDLDHASRFVDEATLERRAVPIELGTP